MIESATVRLDGQDFHLRLSGPEDGPRLLLLHGFPEYSGAWAELMAALPGYRCIAPDQRGYGQSWAPPDVADYRTARLVADMVALIGQIGGGPLAVVGHDWGAAVAYALAIRHPGLVSRLIILNGVHPATFQTALATGGAQSTASQYIDWLRRDGSEDILARDDFARLLALFAEGMDLSWLNGDRLEEYKTAWGRPGRLRGMVNWYRASPVRVAKPGQPFAPPELPADRLQVPMPHLVIWGEADTALLPEARAGLDRFAPDLDIRTIPGADHWLHHTHTATVARHIQDWLISRG